MITLLSSLKNIGGTYPPDLLAARRVNFMKQAAQLGLSVKPTIEGGKGPGPGRVPPSTGALLETALVVAILAEAGAAAYLYRDKLVDLVQTLSSPVIEVVQQPPTSLPSPVASVGTSIGTETPEISATPAFTEQAGGSTAGSPGSASSSSSNIQPTQKPNPGLHLGTTPKPARTKPSDGGGGGSNDGGGGKKPKK